MLVFQLGPLIEANSTGQYQMSFSKGGAVNAVWCTLSRRFRYGIGHRPHRTKRRHCATAVFFVSIKSLLSSFGAFARALG
jgi:hypothetical protein